MPLIHGKSKKAFSENVEREIGAGKPQKQAVAIAYDVKRHAEHKKMGHGGDVGDCMLCGGGAYAKGGYVTPMEDKQDLLPNSLRKEQSGRFKSEMGQDELASQAFPSQLPAIDEGAANYEEGGAVHPEAEGEDELMHGCAGELCEALERKDKKGIVDALRAIMLSMKE